MDPPPRRHSSFGISGKTSQNISDPKKQNPKGTRNNPNKNVGKVANRKRIEQAKKKRTTEIFSKLCQLADSGEVEFSDCQNEQSIHETLANIKDNINHPRYDSSYLENLLEDKSNLLHYAVTTPLSEDTDEDVGGDADQGRPDQNEEDGGASGSNSDEDEDGGDGDDGDGEDEEGYHGDGYVSISSDKDEQEYGSSNYQRYLKRRCKFIIWLLHKYPSMLTQRDSGNRTPLCLLIERCQEIAPSLAKLKVQIKIVQSILENEDIRSKFEEILNSSPGDYQGTLVHLAIQHLGGIVAPFVHMIRSSTMKVRDKDGNTPLHIAVDVTKWRNDVDSIPQRVELIQKLVEICDGEALTKKGGRQEYKPELRKSPYVYMMSQKDKWKESSIHKKHLDLAAYHLKDAYMRLTDDAIFKHLHNGQKSYYLRLDLREVFATNLLDNIENYFGTMKVDTILKEVYLPKQLLTDQIKSEGGDENGPIKITHEMWKKYKNYVKVFDWLRKQGVEKILELTVHDNEYLPHSDIAIKDALKGIEVETWNWIQDDICSDTIVNAARDARHVFLYSTGKRAVIQNWCNGKLTNELKNLQTITLKVDLQRRPTSGDPFSHDYKLEYEELLKSAFPDLAKNKKIMVDVEPLRDPSSPTKALRKDRGKFYSENQTSHWATQIEKISDFVYGIPAEFDIKHNTEVKIAIIDDGVNVEQIKPGSIAAGMSFHEPDTKESALGRHHFPSSNGHGTKMADSVLEVFPKARLYIARVKTCRNDTVKPTLTCESAADGLEWAIEQQVDIILMSWTIEEAGTSQEALDRMKIILDKANKNKILMFCAARDSAGDGKTDKVGFPRSSLVPMFCVGGATSNGLKSHLVGEKDINILCPESILGSDLYRKGTTGLNGKESAGSSIATALAAGAAGLLLYFMSLAEVVREPSDQSERNDVIHSDKKCREDLKSHQVMQSLLDKLVDQNKFLIPTKIAEIESHRPFSEGGLEILKTIVNRIQVNIEENE